jgi:RNA polymerase sigma-70 factor (ECF subfamily)
LHSGSIPHPLRAVQGPARRDAVTGPSSDLAGDPKNIDLVRRARAGDRRAFASLWREYASTVHAVVASVLPYAHVEDVVQDVAVSALGKLDTLRNDAGFAAWLCAIARNRARNVRLEYSRTKGAAGDVENLPAPATVDQVEADEVLAAMRSLPQAYRETLMLRFLAGLSGPEIAERLGMTHGSVRVNLCRGLKLLRDRIGSVDLG